MMKKFWESERYKDAHLAKLDLPEQINAKIMAWIKKDKDMCVFMGTPGIGKTYFCSAYIHHLIEKKKPFYYLAESSFFSFVRDAIGKNWDYSDEIKRICEAKY